jgi:hypothetical protein
MFHANERELLFHEFLHSEKPNTTLTFDKFRELCYAGIPDDYRAQSWRLLAKLIPFEDADIWQDEMGKLRNEYYKLFDKFVTEPESEDMEFILSKRTDVPRT